MSRELKRDLFEELLPSSKGEGSPFISENNLARGGRRPILEEEWQILLSQFDLLKRRLREMESRQENAHHRVDEWMDSTNRRFDRFNQAGSRMEQFLKQTIHEINEKFLHLGSKVTERRLQETKIEEMIDRHRQVLQTYEIRLNQFQKLLQDQEMKLMGAQATLEEARREIARLKKS